MADFVGKKYTLESSDKFDEYMQALGVPEEKRKMAAGTTSSLELTENGGVYTLAISSPLKGQSLTFKNGQEIDEDTIDGRKVKTTFTVEPNKLTQVQKGDKPSTIVREYSPTHIKQTMTLGSVVCTRIFKA